MRAGISAAFFAAFLLSNGSAWSACVAGQSRNCVDFDLVPQISQQIVASEHLATPPKVVPAVEAKPAYTGPTVGVSRTVRQTPTVGYRWAIN